MWKPFSKLSQNEKKQRKIMAAAKQSDPDVIGMMYWTTTGMFESIKKRNDNMWDTPNVLKLKRLWAQGLEEFVWERNPLAVPAGFGGGRAGSQTEHAEHHHDLTSRTSRSVV